jgi:hypothetical protein
MDIGDQPVLQVTFQGSLILMSKDVMKKYMTVILVIIYSCNAVATFDKPQPDNSKSLEFFPNYLLGKYVSADEASIITVADKLITRQYDFTLKEHKDSIDTTYKLIGDTLVNIANKTTMKIVLKGDTIIEYANWTDTLFNISANNVLRKYKEYYFLNSRNIDTNWEVQKLWVKNGLLVIGTISTEEDLVKLHEITASTADTLPANFNITKRQFKKFIRQHGFSNQETFTKLIENSR